MAVLRFVAVYALGTVALWLAAPVMTAMPLLLLTALLVFGAAFASRAESGWSILGMLLALVAINVSITLWASADRSGAVLSELARSPGVIVVLALSGVVFPACLIAGGVVSRHMLDLRRGKEPR